MRWICCNSLVLLVVLMGVSLRAQAGVTITNTALQGSAIAVNATSSVQDVEYVYMQSVPTSTWQGEFSHGQVINRILLKYEETQRKHYTQPWSIQVHFNLTSYNSSGISSPGQGIVQIDYDPAAGVVYNDKSMYIASGGFQSDITVTNVIVTGISPAIVPQDVILINEIEVERHYIFNQVAVTSIGHNINANNTVDFYWAYMKGAEEYDFEWLFISEYDQVAQNSPDYTRATRVTTSNQHYAVNKVYDKGYIAYRVRGVGRGGNAFDKRRESLWTYGQMFAVTNIDDNRNWQYRASYAEEGKAREGLTFFDGSLRSRQSVALNNTESVALISETMYDYEGRAAVQTLPAPDNLRSNQLKFYSAYSLSSVNNNVYSRKDFDGDGFYASCSSPLPPNGMSTQQGASNYYSSSNPDKAAFHAALPDAQLYPFSQTQFGSDGRVRGQSAQGVNHTIGSEHETKYFYATPSPNKLDRLFGNEVGYASHYSQKVAVDPNGQASISYMDLSGKIIATALACEKPNNLEALSSNVNTTFTDNLAAFNKPMEDQPGRQVLTRYFICNTTTPYQFEYNLTRELYNTLCSSHQCTYDLHIRVLDDCNNVVTDDNNQPADYVMTVGPTPFQTQSFIFNFNITFPEEGTYTIEKTLTLNQAALQQAILDYKAELNDPLSPCYISKSAIAGDLAATVDMDECCQANQNCCHAFCQTKCEKEATANGHVPNSPSWNAYVANCVPLCIADDCPEVSVDEANCDALLGQLALDMSPKGQYYETPGWLSTYVFPDNSLAWSIMGFTTPSGQPIQTWAALKANWKNSFATQSFPNSGVIPLYAPDYSTGSVVMRQCTSLVQFHPEYCSYQWCKATESSNLFDANLFLNNTYAYATSTPSTNPHIDLSDSPVGSSMVDNDPFFSVIAPATTAAGAAFKTLMISYLTTVPNSSFSAWDLAGQSGFANCTNCDARWQAFRSLYLNGKRNFMNQAREAAPNHCFSPCDASVPPDDVADGCILVPAFDPLENEKDYINASTLGKEIREPDLNWLTAGVTNNPANPNPPFDWNNTSLINGLQNQYNLCKRGASKLMDVTALCTVDPLPASLLSIYATGPAPLNFGPVDITGGMCCISPSSKDQLVQMIVDAINNHVSTPDFTAEVVSHSPSSSRFRIIAPPSFGANGNLITLSINSCHTLVPVQTCEPAEGSLTMCNGSDDVPCSNQNQMPDCFCKTLTDLESVYLNGDVPQTFPSPDAYILSELNQIGAASSPPFTVTQSQLDHWQANCDCSQNQDPVLGLPCTFFNEPIPAALKCDQPDPCEEDAYDITNHHAEVLYHQLITKAVEDFIKGYSEKCFTTPDYAELFTVTYQDREYHYTLYYYDQAGNLVSTVPPAGVVFLNTAELADVASHRSTGSPAAVRPRVTHHKMVTHYKYNTLDMVIQQSSPDGGLTNYFTDRIGRLVASQNAKQAALPGGNIYSYTLYDPQGRIVEVGEIVNPAQLTQAIAQDDNLFLAFISDPGAQRRQVTKTYYDVAALASPLVQENTRKRVVSVTVEKTADNSQSTYDYATHYSYDIQGNVKELLQENQMLALASPHLASERYKNIKYGYDLISGNVNSVAYQDGADDAFYHQYVYDADNRLTQVYSTSFYRLVGGAGAGVGGYWDRDAKYFYYLHGPLARTELGDRLVQGMDHAYTINGWIKGVNANTLAHQPLAFDHQNSFDIGRDAVSQTVNTYDPSNPFIHKNFATDAMGYTLGYFSDNANNVKDWMPISSVAASLTGNIDQLPFNNTGNSLYNGNIKEMATALMQPVSSSTPAPLRLIANQYRYDQLNRLVSTEAWMSNSFTDYSTAQHNGDFDNAFTYDANGNIMTQVRNGTILTSVPRTMDDLKYWYIAPSVGVYDPSSASIPADATNKLAYVDDNPAYTGIYNDDIDDQSPGNYTYDQIGNLTSDVQEDIANIEWTVYGKVKKITRTPVSMKSDLEFEYDATGNRVLKIVKPRHGLPTGLSNQEEWQYTYYVRDAQGNILATYERTFNGSSPGFVEDYYTHQGTEIYGNNRLGVYNAEKQFQHTTLSISGYLNNEFIVTSYQVQPPAHYSNYNQRALGKKAYELTNHLGNVLVSISDKKLPYDNPSSGTPGFVDYYTADVISCSDYYPFGAPMPGRTFSSPSYRYGFNGQEKDNEITANSGTHYTAMFWEYDARLSRRWNKDPVVHPGRSPYLVSGNNPIKYFDLLGLFESREEAREYKKEHKLKGRIRINEDGYYSIDDAKAGSTIYKDMETGKVTWAALITAKRPGSKTITPFQLGLEWLSGQGPKSRDFSTGDFVVELYKQHQHYKDAVLDVQTRLNKMTPNSPLPDYNYPYELDGIEGVGKYILDYSTLLTAGATGNLIFTYLGSHSLWIEVTSVDVEKRMAIVTFTVHNTSTLESATRLPVVGYEPIYTKTIGAFLNKQVAGRTGATSETEQVLQWNETIIF